MILYNHIQYITHTCDTSTYTVSELKVNKTQKE